MKRIFLIVALLVLFVGEILKVYFIMPFPGSQEGDTLGFAYFLHNYFPYIRIAIILALLYPAYLVFRNGPTWKRLALGLPLALYGFIFYLFNYQFTADRMFYQPKEKVMATIEINKVPLDQVILGVVINGEARAYPVEYIGYHHQVQDSVGGKPVMITYCTVCRSGRAFNPYVNGKKENFRLVGMDHFNAMFEDESTKTWWQQATGEAVAGKLKGEKLEEIPSEQMTLESWLRKHPNSLVMQPDSNFSDSYAQLRGYDRRRPIETTDNVWPDKLWVVGIVHEGRSKAYSWNTLLQKKVLNDTLGNIPVLLLMEPDSTSFHVYHRDMGGETLQFVLKNDTLRDANSASVWNYEGLCLDGTFKGRSLQPVQAYQEYWHSWRTFHPATGN